jgi:hypothetical protein
LLGLGQLLEIIFTFFTLNVGCELEEDPAPLGADAAAPPAAPLLGLAEALASDPLILTWWPTWSPSLEVSPASCQVFPVESVNVQLPAEPFRQPSIEASFSVEV